MQVSGAMGFIWKTVIKSDRIFQIVLYVMLSLLHVTLSLWESEDYTYQFKIKNLLNRNLNCKSLQSCDGTANTKQYEKFDFDSKSQKI